MRFYHCILVCLMIGLPSKLHGQFDGCPWCTTPTTCSQVNEDSPINHCWVEQGEGCQAGAGSCTFEPHEEEDGQLLAELGFTADDIVRIDTLTGELPFIRVDADHLVLWNCQDGLKAIFRIAESGEYHWLNPRQYQDRYSLRAVKIARYVRALRTSRQGVGDIERSQRP